MENILQIFNNSYLAKFSRLARLGNITIGFMIAFFCLPATAQPTNPCWALSSDLTLNAPPLYVQNFNSLPVGAPISKAFRAGGSYLWQCDNLLSGASLLKVVMLNNKNNTKVSGINAQVFDTTARGIGVIVGVNVPNAPVNWILPSNDSATASFKDWLYGDSPAGNVQIQFIKTGDIRSASNVNGVGASIFLSVAGDLYSSGSMWVHASNSIRVINQTCTLTTKNQVVQLGNWNTNTFSSAGTSPAKLFTVQLDNCPGNSAYTVNIDFSGSPDKEDPTLLALNSSQNSAKGVGIQILDQDKQPINLGDQPVKYALPSKTNTFNFYLRYKVTKPPISAGDASGRLIYTLTYM
ncbi:fimbrial protein [Pseudomonas chlororaphis]|uniref:fimbrial protein n=1 Tax=Pseudomonas chlororaphis TaxID=587753 RepID=UPI000BE2C769|nr:fimbrial protein [Pseudomonas chlororaphis]